MTYEEFKERYKYDDLPKKNNPDFLAKGTFGYVFKAKDTHLNKMVVIKETSQEFLENQPESVREKYRLKDEILRIVNLKEHNNIAKYIDYVSDNERDYVVMEHYDCNLRDLLYNKDEKGNYTDFSDQLSFEQKNSILKGILEGLKYLHTKDFVHLDLKPANILITKQDADTFIPKISDFGLSKFVVKDQNSIFKIDAVGTLAYASPEQKKIYENEIDEENAKKNTDLWSFGVIAFEVFTGKLAFGKDGWAEGKQIPIEINDIPKYWQQLIYKCLDPNFNIGYRVQSADECLNILKGGLERAEGELSDDDIIKTPQEFPIDKEPDGNNLPNGNNGKNKKLLKIVGWIGGALILIIIAFLIFKGCKKENGEKIENNIDTTIIQVPDDIKNNEIKDEKISDTKTGEIENTKTHTSATDKTAESKSNKTTKQEKTVTSASEQVVNAIQIFPKEKTIEEQQAEFLKKFNLQMVNVGSFSIGKYEVTQKQWQLVMGSNPSHFKGDNLPVQNVSWDDAQQFIRKLNELTGQNYRLPTASEWKFAASGGNKSKGYKYSGSNDIDEVAWYDKTKPTIIGQFAKNELGIYDMSGNVAEWCSDKRVYGGSWFSPFAEKCTNNSSDDGIKGSDIGFRLALSN